MLPARCSPTPEQPPLQHQWRPRSDFELLWIQIGNGQGNEAHQPFSGGPKSGVLGGCHKVYVENVYVRADLDLEVGLFRGGPLRGRFPPWRDARKLAIS